jgi:hypothetical protein
MPSSRVFGQSGGRCAASAAETILGGDGAPPSIKIGARRNDMEK